MRRTRSQAVSGRGGRIAADFAVFLKLIHQHHRPALGALEQEVLGHIHVGGLSSSTAARFLPCRTNLAAPRIPPSSYGWYWNQCSSNIRCRTPRLELRGADQLKLKLDVGVHPSTKNSARAHFILAMASLRVGAKAISLPIIES